MKELIKRHTALSANIVAFCRYLRTEGFAIAAPEEADALKSIEILEPYGNSETLRLALKTVLTRSQLQNERFDELYNYYWKQVEKATDSKIAEQENSNGKQQQAPKSQDPQFQALKDWLYGAQKSDEEIDLYTYSAAETLVKKDFSHLSEDEIKEIYDIIKMIARRLARQQNRRWTKNKNGKLDIRRTLRQNMRRGGEMLEILRMKKRKQRIQLVLLCDVSKSMELYSRFLIQFAFAFQLVFRRIETFVFSTSLVKISEILRASPDYSGGQSFDKILKDLSENVHNWSGGTRIGDSLKDFVENYSAKDLNSKTIVLIMSDGWDTGDLDVLQENMAFIHKKASKVIWLNPLAGNITYEPTTEGMKIAMPYVDVFSAGHNVDSLKQLSRWL
jgi:uncharacterized protein